MKKSLLALASFVFFFSPGVQSASFDSSGEVDFHCPHRDTSSRHDSPESLRGLAELVTFSDVGENKKRNTSSDPNKGVR